MVFCFFGESCTGKTSAATLFSAKIGAEIVSGKDYLRLAKQESAAKEAFRTQLANAIQGNNTIIYVASEPEDLSLLPAGAKRILFTAELDIIKERFAARMRGNLPPPVAAMIERKHGIFDKEEHLLKVDSGVLKPEDICEAIQAVIE